MRHNVVPLVDVVFAEDDAAGAAGAVAEGQGDSNTSTRPCAIMDQKHCSHTGLTHPDKPGKPLMLKSLSLVWDHPAVRAAAAVAGVRFDATNTVLLDDSPYKTARNPAHTAMHPLEWKRTDEHDMGLAARGAVRSALERFAAAVDGRDVCREISSGTVAAVEGVGRAGGGEGGDGKGRIAGGGGGKKQWLTTADDPLYDMVRASLSVDEADETVDEGACSAGGGSGFVDDHKPSLVITGSSGGECSGMDSLAGESKEEGHRCPLCAFKRNPPGGLQGLFYNHFRNTHADACDDAGGCEAHDVPRRMCRQYASSGRGSSTGGGGRSSSTGGPSAAKAGRSKAQPPSVVVAELFACPTQKEAHENAGFNVAALSRAIAEGTADPRQDGAKKEVSSVPAEMDWFTEEARYYVGWDSSAPGSRRGKGQSTGRGGKGGKDEQHSVVGHLPMTSSAPLSETLRRVRIDEKPPTILTKVRNPGMNDGRKGEEEQDYYQYERNMY